MSDRVRWTVTVCILLILIGGSGMYAVRAQDGDGAPIEVNTPVFIPLAPGQTITRTFTVLAGDSFELRLFPLARYPYTAVLLDPSGAPTPLTPDADGNVVFPVASAAPGGLYSLVLQASDPGGQMLVQVNSAAASPEELPAGPSDITVPEGTARYTLPPGTDLTSLTLSAPDTGLPAITLIDPATGEVILMLVAGLLPELTIQLDPDTAYILTIEAGETPVTVQVERSEPSGSEPPPDQGESPEGPSTLTPTPTAFVSTCEITIVGTDGVNLRSGPGTEFNPPLGSAPPGSVLPVVGRSADFAWYQVDFNGLIAWIAGDIPATQASGDCTMVPVTDSLPDSATATPTVTPGGPTLTPTSTPTSTLTPSITPTATASVTPGGPTLTPTATPTSTLTPSATNTVPAPSSTFTLTPTNTLPAPSSTFTPSYTPTTQQQPTATFTPSYTPTTPPPPPEAPPDARFNSPLTIPLDSTTSVTDFVSYPGGDTEDRVRWDISGMNPNPSLSGGRARLIVAVSCFGTGTQNVQFFTGGQTYTCGQAIVDQEVTYDSRTGQVTITAVSGENTYVQWVLTGTATRVN